MEFTAQRGIRGGWKESETELLWQEVNRAIKESQPLKHVFDEVARSTGRKSNSIRNYYYAQRREREDAIPSQRALPFVPFTDEEVRDLMRKVLTAKAQGKSVRACVQELGGGDRALMLRYQNKYRSVLKTRPGLVKEIIAELSECGINCPEILKEPRLSEPFEKVVREVYAETMRLGNPQVSQLMDSLRALLKMANGNSMPRRRPDEYDRMSVQSDMLRLQIDDMRNRQRKLNEAIGQHLAVCKEHLGLPKAQRLLHDEQFETAMLETLGNLESTLSTLAAEQEEDEGLIRALTLRLTKTGTHDEEEMEHVSMADDSNDTYETDSEEDEEKIAVY